MNSRASKLLLASASVVFVVACGSTAMARSPACTAPDSWFTDGIPDPLIHAKAPNPVEGVANSGFNSFCSFHTWSWNAFLWLMEDVDGVPRFESLPTLDNVIAGDFTAGGEPNDVVTLRLRTKKTEHPINGIAQADTPGILVDQNGRAVYYSQHVNKQMYNDIVGKKWNTFEGLQAESPKASFEIGDIEIKAAWKVVGPGEDASYAYVRKASIPLAANIKEDGVVRIGVPSDPAEQKFEEVDVALVGFHVVGWVKDHAEAIWATFSPPDIAPTVISRRMRIDDSNYVLNPDYPVSDKATPFYAANAPYKDCNQTSVPIQELDEETQIFKVRTNACLVFSEGTTPNEIFDSNQMAIVQLNESVRSQLKEGSLARLYSEIGAVWSKSDGAVEKVGTNFQDILIGSKLLSNPVIETFTQTQMVNSNCLGCHNSNQYQPADPSIPPLKASLLNISHITLQAYLATAPKP